MKYAHVISEVLSTPWLIRPEKLSAILSLLRLKAAGGEVTAEDIASIKQSARAPFLVSRTGRVSAFHAGELTTEQLAALFGKPQRTIEEIRADLKASAPSSSSRSRAGSVAVLPLFGVISYRMGMMSESSGGTSTERFTQWFRAAMADATVKAIIIDIDSPGGTVSGVPELADEIFRARGQKPVVAIANAEAASAAYWLGCQADELVVTPSGEVGSVGVWCAHQDVSKFMEQQGVKTTLVSSGKYKVEGNPYEPLSADGLAALQQSCDEVYDTFLRAVARGREASLAEVRANFGEGRMVSAAKAVKAGMADRTGTLDQTLARLGAKPKEKLPERVALDIVIDESQIEELVREATAQAEEDSAAAAAPTATDDGTASASITPTLTEHERAARQRELELYRI